MLGPEATLIKHFKEHVSCQPQPLCICLLEGTFAALPMGKQVCSFISLINIPFQNIRLDDAAESDGEAVGRHLRAFEESKP